MRSLAGQLDLELPSTKNAVLVDAHVLRSLLTELRASYDADLFSDLCGLLVQVVLRDRIYLVPPRGPIFMDDPFLRPWLDEGVAYRYRTPRRAVRDSAPRNVAAPIIAAAFNAKLPVFAAGGIHDAFEDFASRRVEHAICDLLGQYMRFEEQAIQTLLKYRLVRPSYWQFRVPPLPLEILRRCKSIEQVPYATLEVRHEHSGLRRQFAEMNGLISDPSVLPKRKIREVRKLESSLAAIGRVAEGEALVTFSNSGGYMLSGAVGGAQAIYGVSLGDGAKGVKGGAELLKSAAAIAKMAMSDRFKAWRLEPLHRSIDRWMKTSDTEMIDQVSRLFGPPR